MRRDPRRASVPEYLLAIDQGTTSTRAIVFDPALAPVASAQKELRQIYPAPGLVEHDADEIWSATLATVRTARRRAGQGDRRAGDHQPARDRSHLGPRNEPPDPQCHRVAGSAHGGPLRSAAAGWPRAHDRGAHWPAARSLFFRHQDRVAPRPCR